MGNCTKRPKKSMKSFNRRSERSFQNNKQLRFRFSLSNHHLFKKDVNQRNAVEEESLINDPYQNLKDRYEELNKEFNQKSSKTHEPSLGLSKAYIALPRVAWKNNPIYHRCSKSISPLRIVEFNDEKDGRFFEFSNLYESKFIMEGEVWSSIHQFMSANIFSDRNHAKKVRSMLSLEQITSFVLLHQAHIRDDWHEVKDNILFEALYEKFSQKGILKGVLQNTENAALVYHTTDEYWGDGGDGSGYNKLGLQLMVIRMMIRYGFTAKQVELG